MPVATAEQLRNRPILVPVPGTDLQIECRRPDPLTLIADGILPLPIFGGVLEQLTELAHGDSEDATSNIQAAWKTYLAFVDHWVCAAAVKPRVVLTEEEALADRSTYWVQELEQGVRYDILQRTNSAFRSDRLRTAVQEFRRQQSVGAAAGPSSAPVREDPVTAVASA